MFDETVSITQRN